jgi:hypothetical protein
MSRCVWTDIGSVFSRATGTQVAGNVFSGIVAFLHFYFFLLETFLWRVRAEKVFGV